MSQLWSCSHTLCRYFEGWTTRLQFPTGTVVGWFSSPPQPDRLWGPPKPLIYPMDTGYSYPEGKAGGA